MIGRPIGPPPKGIDLLKMCVGHSDDVDASDAIAAAIEECRAGLVLQGRLVPTDCPEFGTRCTPEHPLGATMVSSEGACAAYWQYGGARRVEAAE